MISTNELATELRGITETFNKHNPREVGFTISALARMCTMASILMNDLRKAGALEEHHNRVLGLMVDDAATITSMICSAAKADREAAGNLFDTLLATVETGLTMRRDQQ